MLLAASSPAAAAPKGGAPPGNPHAEGATGKPHPAAGKGNPHVTAPATTTTTTTTASPPPPKPSSKATPPAVSSLTKQVTATGGKPCNGCVGNANGRTPPGQKNNPGDGNHGHSCDGNKGIGKGNPAHEGCTASTTTTTVTTPTTPTRTLTTTPETPVVLGETLTRGGSSTKVLGVTLARGSLASTGGDMVDLTVLAVGLLALGTALRWRARRT